MRWVWLLIVAMLCVGCNGQPIVSEGTYCQGISMDANEGCHEGVMPRQFWFVGDACPDPLIRPSRLGAPVNVWYLVPFSCQTTVVSYHPL